MQRQTATAIIQRFQQGAGQCQPLLGAVRAKTAGNQPQRISRLLLGLKHTSFAKVLANALQRLPFQRRTDVVEHQTAHLGISWRLGQSGHHHANQPAHAGAHPVQGVGLEMPQQGQHVGGVGGNLVQRWVLEPITLTAPGDIGADHTDAFARVGGVLANRLCQHIKVPPLPRQAMHTQHHMRTVNMAPLPISHAVAALRVWAS